MINQLSNSKRDTVILPVRIKRTMLGDIENRVSRKKVSRNSWMIWAIKEGLRSHTKKELKC